MSIRIGILGYGNLGRGVECAIKHNPDLELVAVFTRRAPETVKILTETAAVYSVNDAEKMKDKIDVLIICGGSATDLPKQTPEYAKMFNVIDSFDTHARIPEHFDAVDAAAKESGHIGIISVGWDPGMFSLNRLYANAILTNGKDYTFWGKGVSQGHSDAVRRNYSDGSGQQLITLVSKSGATFYLVIDRNAKGQQTVHFMNLVDEADLLALMEEDAADAYTAEKEAAAQAEQDKLKAEEEAKKAAEEAAASGEEQPTENKVTKIASGFLGVVVLIALAAGGGFYVFAKQKQKKQAEKEALDPDAGYTEDKGDFEIPTEDEPEDTGEEDTEPI